MFFRKLTATEKAITAMLASIPAGAVTSFEARATDLNECTGHISEPIHCLRDKTTYVTKTTAIEGTAGISTNNVNGHRTTNANVGVRVVKDTDYEGLKVVAGVKGNLLVGSSNTINTNLGEGEGWKASSADQQVGGFGVAAEIGLRQHFDTNFYGQATVSGGYKTRKGEVATTFVQENCCGSTALTTVESYDVSGFTLGGELTVGYQFGELNENALEGYIALEKMVTGLSQETETIIGGRYVRKLGQFDQELESSR